MSCFIVNRKTIAVLTQALMNYELAPTYLHPDAIGQQLWIENFASYNSRYEETIPVKPYIHPSLIPAAVDDVMAVYKIARCYEYQACEHPTWQTSLAWQMMQRLLLAIEQELGMSAGQIIHSQAYEKAPWGL